MAARRQEKSFFNEIYDSENGNFELVTFAGSKPVIRGKTLSVSVWNVLPAWPAMCALSEQSVEI